VLFTLSVFQQRGQLNIQHVGKKAQKAACSEGIRRSWICLLCFAALSFRSSTLANQQHLEQKRTHVCLGKKYARFDQHYTHKA
jgi:hypothetical protein